MTSAAYVASRTAALNAGEKGAASAKAGSNKQADAIDGSAAAPPAAAAVAAAASRRTPRPLRRLKEGDAFILDINAGDRQCLMHARASRLVFFLFGFEWDIRKELAVADFFSFFVSTFL